MTHSIANWKQDDNMGIGGNKSVILVTLYIDGSEPEMMMKMPLLHTTYVLGFPLSRDFSNFQVPGLLDFFSPGTTGPWDLQGL